MASSIASTLSGQETTTVSEAEALAASSHWDALAPDVTACRAMLKQGSKSFYLASRLLPQRMREPTAALYAFCRLADDAVDLEGGKDEALSALAERLDRVYAGNPDDDPVERALSATVRRFAIPRAVLDGLIEGLAWDAEERRYETLADLQAYAARVASTVGVASTLLMGVRSEQALARAADLGVAMQLTNISRDVGEDARAGRIYLPLQWMRDAGIDPDAWLQAPEFDDRLATVIERLLFEAERLYRRSVDGIALLPADCRLGIHAARLVYREIGQELARRGYDSVSRRMVVPAYRKLFLVIKASFASSAKHADPKPQPPLAETAFLIEAVTESRQSTDDSGAAFKTKKPSVSERIGLTIELFTRLEEEDRLSRERDRKS
ncbi:MAG: phytoene/squalene synthase family protein [Pseudomonadota bacterium]